MGKANEERNGRDGEDYERGWKECSMSSVNPFPK